MPRAKTEGQAGTERELWPRADGIAHAWSERRLYPAGRNRSGALLHCGWTILEPRKGGGFFYNDKLHDKGEKVVLGHVIPAGGGIDDGEKVLDIPGYASVDREDFIYRKSWPSASLPTILPMRWWKRWRRRFWPPAATSAK